MNQETDVDRFEARIASALRASAGQLPAGVAGRLASARVAAVTRAGSRHRSPGLRAETWLGALTLAGVAALALWITPTHEAPTRGLSPEVALDVATLAEPELIEDLEFYAWLEANPLEEAG